MVKKYYHRVQVRETPSDQNVFRWHWPRGTFDKRMSAYEIATFLLPYMAGIVPFLPTAHRIQAEFEAMLVMLATQPRAVLDQIVPWIRPRIGEEEDDIIELHLQATALQEAPRTFFVQPGAPR